MEQPATVRAYARQNAKTIIVVAVIVLLAAALLYQTQVAKQAQNAKAPIATVDRKAAAHVEATTLRNKVSKILELPSTETPTVATVSDAAKLQNQAFFSNAKNGDKVLMFAQAKQVILFRPATNKVIQVAPIDVGTGAPVAQ